MPETRTAESNPGARGVVETAGAVIYSGVKLHKAEHAGSIFVPERIDSYITDDFALRLQRDIATSWITNDPMLIEGGTSLGKTTTVRKMAAELGYEVHYINLNGATDVEDLMGRFIPNINKRTPDDPEYVFADGQVTSGLRPEEGRVKIIVLDEYNAAAPNILIRLHEVLDALQSNGTVILSEDASEPLQTDRDRTKVVALMNPPGKGYLDRQPLDPAQLRRWVYHKAPSELPKETFSYATDALFGLVPPEQDESELTISPRISRDQALQPEQLKEIPGIDEILAKYKEFHAFAKEQVAKRKVGADQPQPFAYDDRMEPRRVRDFILQFYNGDISATMQEALEYYYLNKLESEGDRSKLKEAMKHVIYVPPRPTFSQRHEAQKEREEKNIKRFSSEQRRILENRGYRFFFLDGDSLSELQSSQMGASLSLDIESKPHDRYDQGRSTEVAVPGDFSYFDNSYSETYNQQNERVAQLSHRLSYEIPGVKAIIGSAADYASILIQDQFRGRFYGHKLESSTNYIRTSSSAEGTENSIIIFLPTPNVVRTTAYGRSNSHERVRVIPLIIPDR